MSIVLTQEQLRYKKIAIYSKLHNKGMLSLLNNSKDTFPRLEMTADEVMKDIETNYPWIIQTITKPTIINNMKNGTFVWNETNYPLLKQLAGYTFPGIYIWQTSGNIILTDDAKITALGNTNCLVSNQDNPKDNMYTYNNKMFKADFNHTESGSIIPIANATRDAYYDLNVTAAITADDVTYDATDYHVTYYVWYIKDNGIDDYQGYGGLALVYPYENCFFPYRQYNVNSIPTLNMSQDIHIVKPSNLSQTEKDLLTTDLIKENEHTNEGYNFYLTAKNQLVNFVVRGNFNTLATTGQKYAYQGMTIKTFEPFINLPSSIVGYVLDNNEYLTDITTLIETTLTWDFPNIVFEVEDTNIADVEVSSMNEGTINKIIGPTINIRGKRIGNTNLNIIVYLKESNNTDDSIRTYKIPLSIIEKYTNVVNINVTNYSSLNLTLTDSANLNIVTNATSYTITPDITGRFNIENNKVTAISLGSGYINIKGIRDGYKSTTISIPYNITEFKPELYIKADMNSVKIDGTDSVILNIETNCNKSFFNMVLNNDNIVKIGRVEWLTDTPYERVDKYSIKTATIKIIGIKKGSSILTLSGRFESDTKLTSLNIPISVINLVNSSDVEYVYTNQISTIINQEDAYVRFHTPTIGTSTILVSRGNKSRAITIPKISQQMIDDNGSNSFNLITEEEFYNNVIDGKVITNPNCLDDIVSIDPTGNGVFLNNETGEVFIDGKGTHSNNDGRN
jgi:hypothetical protein